MWFRIWFARDVVKNMIAMPVSGDGSADNKVFSTCLKLSSQSTKY